MESEIEGLLAGLASSAPPDGSMELFLAEGAAALVALTGTINLNAVAAAEGALLLHAGAVCRADGETAVLCGPSGSGKSTLTAVLAERGHAYLTDETVCLAAEDLRIKPFRKPLSIKPGSHPVLPHLRPAPPQRHDPDGDHPWIVAPDAVNPSGSPEGLLLPEVVIFPTYVVGAGVQVEAVSAGEAAYLLGGNSSRLQMVHGGGLPVLARLVRRAPAFRILHGDVHAAADAVQELWAAVA